MYQLTRHVSLVLFGSLIALSIASTANATKYQKYLNGQCDIDVHDCVINFPNVPAGKALDISNVSCYLRGPPPFGIYSMQLLQILRNGTIGNAVTLVPAFIDSVGSGPTLEEVYSANHVIFAFATAGQHFQAVAQIRGLTPSQFACHISGQLTQ
jgi:hypothetical protein